MRFAGNAFRNRNIDCLIFDPGFWLSCCELSNLVIIFFYIFASVVHLMLNTQTFLKKKQTKHFKCVFTVATSQITDKVGCSENISTGT